jgi:general secretion pathway protein D
MMTTVKHPWNALWATCVALAWAGAATHSGEVPATQPATRPTTQPAMVELIFPENMELKALVDYVGKRLGVNFIYDEQVGGRRVTIKAPEKVPAGSLMTLLETVLRMKGLAMQPESGGMIRIELAKQLTAISVGPKTIPDPSSESRPTMAVTRVFELKYVTPQRADEVIKPFLTGASATTTALAEHNLLIVTDYAGNMKRLEGLVELVDRPKRDAQVRFVTIKHFDAAAMVQKVTQVLAGKAKARGGAAAAATGATLVADDRMNQVAVVGSAEEVKEAAELITSLDVPLGLETKTYTFAVASCEQVDRLVRELIGELTAKRLYKSATDREANLLIATTTPDIHEQIESLRKGMDKPVAESQSPIRFYKLENAKAADVVATLQRIDGDAGMRDASVDGVTGGAKTPVPAPAPAAGPGDATVRGPTEAQVNRGAGHAGRTGRTDEAMNPRNGRVMADEASNTIIVVARPAMHAVYEKLIKRLDVRRPQVLIEATVVALDTTNDFALGVEFSTNHTFDNKEGKVLTFSSFGLSTPDPQTGQLTLRPGTGFTGALLSADIANIVIHALQSDSRAKVMSRPSVLVNDNATGTLVSENEEPFSSVNASATVATTSFAGYSSAGTKIIITPQISEGEYLKVKYEITLSAFGGTTSPTLPPARQTNSLASEATIPDGHTIVVGGLTRENFSDAADRVPMLGTIPGLEFLFSNRTKSSKKTTLFVFIRAVILRSDKFEDLKALSRAPAARTGLPGEYPASEPLGIE